VASAVKISTDLGSKKEGLDAGAASSAAITEYVWRADAANIISANLFIGGLLILVDPLLRVSCYWVYP
jgi:hypothetical protein